MTMREKIAKALHDYTVAQSPPDGHKRYWETAPVQVKNMMLGMADVALETMRDYLRLKEMDGTASLSELTELDALDEDASPV